MEQRRCYGCMRLHSGDYCPHCGYPAGKPNKPHQLQPGTVLRGQYEVGRVLGQGGFGITYLGWDRHLETPVCVKEYYPNHAVTRETSVTTEISCHLERQGQVYAASKERFLREAKILAQLRDIPEIVSIYGFFEENNTVYIVMEYIKGMDLAHYVASRGGRLTADETFRLLRPVMQALTQVHRAELVHRDIAPDNIMLHPRGGAKLLDFGSARMVEDAGVDKGLNRSTEAIVKHGFAPMEQYQSRGNLGPWTDVYAMCATVYYCLTGRVPPEATSRMMGEGELNWEGAIGLTQRQRAALEKGMAVLAKDRYGSMEELMEGLFSAAPAVPEKTRSLKGEPQKKENAGKKPSGGKKRSLTVALCILAVGLLVSLGLLIWGGGKTLAPQVHGPRETEEAPVMEAPPAEAPPTEAPPAEEPSGGAQGGGEATVPPELLPPGDHTVGVICDNNRQAELINEAIQRRLPDNGNYEIQFLFAPEESRVFRTVMDWAENGVEAVIWYAGELENADVINQVVLTAEACRVELIVTGFDPEFKTGPGILETSPWGFYAGIDPRSACREMGRLLLASGASWDKNSDGELSYVFLGTSDDMNVDCAGYLREIMEEAGVSSDLLVAYEIDRNEASAQNAMNESFSRFDLGVEVVFCTDERMAGGVMDALEAWGLEAGDDVTVVCAGDTRLIREHIEAGNILGSVTYSDSMRMGTVMEALCDILHGDALPGNYRKPCKWITGGDPEEASALRGRVTGEEHPIMGVPTVGSAPLGYYKKDAVIEILRVEEVEGCQWGLTRDGWIMMDGIELLD